MKLDFISSPVFIILTSLVSGILLSYYIVPANTYWWALPFLLSLLTFGLTLFSGFKINDYLLKTGRALFISFFFIGTGMLVYNLNTPSEIKIDGKVDCEVSGRVEETSSMTTGDRLLVEIDRITGPDGKEYRNPGKAYITTGATNIKPGDRVEFRAPLSEAGRNLNYRNSDNSYLRHRHIYYSAYVDEKEIAYGDRKQDLKSRSLELRDNLEIFIEKTPLSGETKNFLISLLLGDKEAMTRESREKFADSGISHILAVSGMHIGIITSIILMLLYPLSLFWNHKWRFIIAIPIVWAYVWLTGSAPSTTRAAIMITFYFIAIILERKHNTLAALGWAAILILLFNPYALFDIGFQLSFTCVFFLLLTVNELNFVDRLAHPRLYNMTSMVLITLVATLASWALISVYFQKIVTLFLPANLLIVPLLPLFVILSLAYLGLVSGGIEIEFLRRIIDSCYDGAHEIITRISSTGNVETLQIGWPSVALWLLGLTLAAVLIRQRVKRKIYIGAAAGILALSLVTIPLFKEAAKPDGFIIQKSFPYITMASYQGKEEAIVTLPGGKISTFEHSGKKVVVLDGKTGSAPLSDELTGFLGQADFVVVGSGFKDEGNGLIERLNKDALILMHSSMRKKKEKELSEQTFASWEIHSIRNDGPFHCFD